jgi:hypothetical protein
MGGLRMMTTIPISHYHLSIKQLQRHWRGRRVIYNGFYAYYGWTGFECFGAITPYRYFGWCVTCWADVAAKAFGNARDHRFFDKFDEAAYALNKLMDIAKRMHRLAHKKVKYWEPDWPIPREIEWQARSRLTWIRPDMKGDPRSPSSPAYWRRFMRRHPDAGRPKRNDYPDLLGGKLQASYL